MPAAASFPDDDVLRQQFGPATFARAKQYVERGHVIECTYQFDGDGDLDIRGRVRGSVGGEYAAFLSAGAGSDGHWVYTRCSCPVADQCKHALALLMTVIDQERSKGGEVPAGPGWERALDLVLDELDADADVQAAQRSPLALQVDVARPAPPKQRWGRATVGRGQLRLRPLQRGSRGSWVRTGVSWQTMSTLERRGDFEPDQVGALHALLAAHQSAQRHGYLGAEPYLRLQSFGPSLWLALEQAILAGVELVPGPGLSGVRVHDEPVGLRLDVSAAEAETRVQVGIELGGQWYSADAIELLGEQSHGVALWQPEPPYAVAVTLAPLDRPAGPQVRRLLAGTSTLVVPAADRDDLVAGYLPRLQRHLDVGSSDGSVTVPKPVHPRLALVVRWVAADEVELTWSFRYLVGADDRVYGLTEARGLRAGLRRPAEERALLDALRLDEAQRVVLCGSHRDDDDPTEQQILTGMGAVGFAEDVLPALAASERVEVEEIGARPAYQPSGSAPVIRFASRADAPPAPGDTELIDDRTDWLDLEVIITVDGTPLALPALLEALTMGQRRIVLATGVHVSLDHPGFRHLAELIDAAAELHDQPDDGAAVRVGHHDLGLWEELAEIGLVDEQAGQWVRAAQALRGIDTLPVAEPVGVTAQLRHYQTDGFRWLAFLWESALGGILGDDMGLGKTLQTLALVAHARSRGAEPFLVVAPTSVVATWVHEAMLFTPGLEVRAVTESHARRGDPISQVRDGADIVVTSYTLYRLEAADYVAEQWGGLVLDEAQAVKNHLSKTYQAVRRLDAPFRLAITGTPMENRLMELWSLLSIVAPGLYAYPDQFAEIVAVPVEKLGDSAALERFRRRIRPFLLRRTKELVAADLPPKQEQVLEVQLTPKHRRIYDTHLQRERQHVLGLVEDFDKHRIAIFGSLTKLRQLSLDAALVDEAYEGTGSAKLDALVDHLHEVLAEGHRALVFSQFTSFLTRVRARLDAEGIASTYLDGRTRRRVEVVDEFKRGDAGVFLISLKAGGVGLTLTEADYVFVLDPWWNPAVEAQAVDRAHRIGQSRPVMVYRLVSSGTIEEKVMELKGRKAALFAKVLDGDGAMSAPITASDVRALFAD